MASAQGGAFDGLVDQIEDLAIGVDADAVLVFVRRGSRVYVRAGGGWDARVIGDMVAAALVACDLDLGETVFDPAPVGGVQ